MMLFLTILISLILGFVPYYLISKETNLRDVRFFVNLFIPIGIGVSSVLFVVFSICKFSFLTITILEIILIILAFYWFKILSAPNLKASFKLNATGVNQLFKNPFLLLFTVVYVYALLLNAGVFLFDTVEQPHGQWDAWNYWNMKAKFISNAPNDWPALFHQMSSEEYHVDYPLLQTGYIALCWISLKADTVWVPILIAFLFTFCTIGLLSYSVKHFSNKINGLIAGLIMLCTPFYMFMGDAQYADNTVGYFYLATIVLLTFARMEMRLRPVLYVLTGVAAGFSAWSKNEGLLFIVCLFMSQLTLLPSKGFRALFHELKYIAAGILPTLILIIYYKFFIAAPNDIVNAQGQSTLIKLTDISRYKLISQWFLDVVSTFGKWNLTIYNVNIIWLLFLIGALYTGVDFKKYRASLIPNLTLVLLMLLGFFFIYVITPLDLNFHLSTSLHRLYFQLFPSFIFLYFISLKNTNKKV